MPLDPQIAACLQNLRGPDARPASVPDVDSARIQLRALVDALVDPAAVPEVASVGSAVLADSVPARVYRPAARGPAPTVVYLHGGGWTLGDLDTHDSQMRRLCHDVGAVVVGVDYRLAPEHRFPAAVDDAYAALTAAARHIEDFGGDPTRIAVAGDSAGATLAAVCAQQARTDGLQLAAQFLLYPSTDIGGAYPSRITQSEGFLLSTASLYWFYEQYLGVPYGEAMFAEFGADPRVSPSAATDLSGLAPAVVATAEFDPLCDEGDRYAAALRDAGVPVEHLRCDGLIHGFYGMEHLSAAVADATGFLHTALRKILA